MVDNRVYNLSDTLPEAIIDPWIIVDRVEIDTEDASQLDRLSQSLSVAFEHGEDVVGIIDFSIQEEHTAYTTNNKEEKTKAEAKEGFSQIKGKKEGKIKNTIRDGKRDSFLDSEGGMQIFSRAFRCPHCGYVPPELTLSHFSFNSPTGACPTCH